eukprot:TRINITY_DN5898_c0_g2_i3.p1 TRINITY_DN5898_c0_g2~~TRINITY_DN5898_c0_g2_i3.p1  ORF type:complete len:123 (+),score=23.17 TRINITY_DN5898_c0_g2_i3:125-493(+)
MKDLSLYHTIFWGIEIKVTDFLMCLFNLGGIAVCLTLFLLSYGRGLFRKNRGTIFIGNLCHLADIANNELYRWKPGNTKLVAPKKKGPYKVAAPSKVGGKQLQNSEEIVCNTCRFSIKTRRY